MRGTLYLVNYAKKDTEFEDQILLIKVKSMGENAIYKDECTEFTRDDFQKWFRNLNKECLGPEEGILARNPIYVRNGFHHARKDCAFMRGKKDYATFDQSDTWAYRQYRFCKECYPNGNRL